MGTLGKDLLRLDKSFFEFTVLFSEDDYEIEGKVYRLGELTTAFLNYDASEFLQAAEELKTNLKHKEADALRRSLEKMLRVMPLYGDMAQEKETLDWRDSMIETGLVSAGEMRKLFGGSDNDFPNNCAVIAKDIRLIQDRYTWLLRDMFYRDFNLRTPNRYAVQLYENGLGAFVSGRSLGRSSERDPTPAAVQFEVRESTADGKPRLFEKLIFTRLADFIYTELFRAMMHSNCPRPCKNCGKWFLKEKTSTCEYCDNIAPGEVSKTCRDVGATASFSSKVKNNEVWKLHQRAYKKYYARVMKRNMTQADFNTWAQSAEQLRDQVLQEYEKAREMKQEYSLKEYEQELNRL